MTGDEDARQVVQPDSDSLAFSVTLADSSEE